MFLPGVGGIINDAVTGNIAGIIQDFTGLLITQERSFGTIFPDVTLKEIGTDELIITDHPVEKGVSISDHSFKRPVGVELEYTWSDCSNYIGYSRDQYDALIALMDAREPFEISTGKRLYKNMLPTSIQQVTDQVNENALLVTIVCREIIFAQTETAQVDQTSQALPSETADITGGPTSTTMPVLTQEPSRVTKSIGFLT